MPDTGAPPGLPADRLSGRLQGSAAFRQALLDAMGQAAREGWREWWWCDPDFADWPLGERTTIELLNQWAGHGRKLYVLAADYRQVPLRHPRFMAWRRTWDHLIQAKAWSPRIAGVALSGMWSPSWCIQRIDMAHSISLVGDDVALRTTWRQTLDEAWQQASPSFAASVLGL